MIDGPREEREEGPSVVQDAAKSLYCGFVRIVLPDQKKIIL